MMTRNRHKTLIFRAKMPNLNNFLCAIFNRGGGEAYFVTAIRIYVRPCVRHFRTSRPYIRTLVSVRYLLKETSVLDSYFIHRY